jgi:MFS family permease
VATLSPTILKQTKDFPFNFSVNIMDGGFFGMALGFASFSTVLPLFVSGLTDSAILIGLITAIHVLGWQLPQLFTAHWVSQQKRYKPLVMFFTIFERVPFLGLAIVAWFIPQIGVTLALVLTFSLLIIQGVAGGLAANPWQSMIGKIFPRERWGVFFGAQSSASSLFFAAGAVVAGKILQNNSSNTGFTACFLLAIVAFTISYIAIGLTREEAIIPVGEGIAKKAYWKDTRNILKSDHNFRWFIVVRILAQLGSVGFVFYTVYVVLFYGVDEAVAGILTAVMMIAQMVFNPIMGWLGDHWSRRGVMALGMICAAVSAIIIIWAPTMNWFYLSYALAGIAQVAIWTIALSMTLEFGDEHLKPAYIGLANTLIAPTALLFPLIAGWLADSVGYPATFLLTAIGAVITALVLGFVMQDNPKPGTVAV